MSEPKTSPAEAFDAALRILTARDHSEAQLAAKLARRGFTQACVRETLTRLRELTYIDDRRFARALVRERLLVRQRGWTDIRARLFAAGLDGGLIDEILGELRQQEDLDEAAVCLRAARKRLASLRESDPRKRRDKLMRHLAGRGFSPRSIQAALDVFSGGPFTEKDMEDDLDIDPDS